MPADEHGGDARAVVLRLVDAWNDHDLAAAASCITAEFENHQLPLGVVVGRDAYLTHLRSWFAAYPDLRVEVRTCFSVADTVCLEVAERGTRRGTFGEAPPHGGPETFFGCDVFEVRDGRVAIQRGYWDYSVATGLPAPRAGGHGPDDSRFFQPHDLPGR
ncbi:MAG: ester cyclase [Solirubrobacteraceae bacterium]